MNAGSLQDSVVLAILGLHDEDSQRSFHPQTEDQSAQSGFYANLHGDHGFTDAACSLNDSVGVAFQPQIAQNILRVVNLLMQEIDDRVLYKYIQAVYRASSSSRYTHFTTNQNSGGGIKVLNPVLKNAIFTPF
jgi:hypothetical protein